MLSLYITLYFQKTLYLLSLESLVFSPPHDYRPSPPDPGGTKAQTSSHHSVASLVLIVYVSIAVLLLCWLGSPEMHTTFFLSPLTSCRSCAWKEHSVHSFSLDHGPSPALNQGLHLNGVLSSLAWSAFIPAISYLPSFKRHPYTNMFSTHLLHIKYCWQKDLPSSGE